MPDPKRRNPTPIERPANPDPERERRPAGGDHPGDVPIEVPPRDPDPNRDEPSPRLIHPEDEDRKVRTDKGEKRPFGVMP